MNAWYCALVSIMSCRFINIVPVPLLFAIAMSVHAQTAPVSVDSKASENEAVASVQESTNVSAQEPATPTTSDATDSSSQKNPADPWQGYNRAMFSFNTTVDKHLLKPLAKTYVRFTPSFFRQGVSNVFSNIMDVPSALNDVLQGKFSRAAHDSGRVLINSTLGIAGLLDVAQHMGLQGGDGEDFGQTLAVWGVGSGPYVVLPFLGPSTLRDTTATPVDWYSDPTTYIDHIPTKNTMRGVSILNTRANFLPLEKSVTGDKYVFIRDAYLQRRNYLVNDGQVEDSFGAEETEDGDY